MLLVLLFTLGYLAIVFEHPLGVNKAASALVMGVACWTVLAFDGDPGAALGHRFSELAQIVFFLLGAMVIVELIDSHDGFELITSRITTRSRRRLLVVISMVAFFLSAVLDNLTTSIVMMSLVRKLAADDDDRMTYGGIVIIAANAGGVWSPIGDVTTTMLWVGGQVTGGALVAQLIIPAFVSVVVPLLWLGWRMKGDVRRPSIGAVSREGDAPIIEVVDGETAVVLPADAAAIDRSLVELDLRARTAVAVTAITRDGETRPPVADQLLRPGDRLHLAGEAAPIAAAIAYLVDGQAPRPTTTIERWVVLGTGVGVLLAVPPFKVLTGLPPVMGILLGLGILWVVTELIHKRKNDENKSALSAAGALRRVDSQSVLFFLGILLAIGALESAGTLRGLAGYLDSAIGNVDAITVTIGLSSAVIDNVPLVAASQGMYPMTTFSTDHHFWLFLAYCAGTGGSILIIGSAAGIAVMGIQRITFGWYVKRFSFPALLGYFAGALAYLAMSAR